MSSKSQDCTALCASAEHGSALVSAVTRRDPTDEELAAYMSSVCMNLGAVKDELGRLVLHMAVSCGRRDLVQWLIRRHGTSVNAKDLESGYTPLHRSLFYGQIHVAVSLMQMGASLSITDYDFLTPLDHVMKDRHPSVEFNITRPCELYVWGSNANYNLGTGNQQARAQPELLDCFRKMNISIRQVCMDKFHTVIVSNCGRVWSCGHGQGGRLGLRTESTVLTPQEVPLGFVSPTASSTPIVGSNVPEECIMAAVGRDHTILVTKSDTVLSCGLNTHHVLGHSPPPAQILKPRPIFPKHLRACWPESIKGVCAGRFHSVLWTSRVVLTFGLHAGQLGHAEGPEKTVILPKAISSLNHKDTKITHVAASDGATVVVSKMRYIFVFHEYQKIRLTAKHAFDVAQVTVVGGHLDPKVDTSSLLDKGDTLKVVALSTIGTVYIWQEKELQLTRCILAINRQLTISHLAMSRHSLVLVSRDGEAFIGVIKPRKRSEEGRRITQQVKKESEIRDFQQKGPNLYEFLDPSECDTIALERLPHIHRAVGLACDPKGRNFAVIQTHPSASLVDIPQVPPSEMREHLSNLLKEASEGDALHDLIFQVGLRRYAAHQFIIANNSEVLQKLIKKHQEECKEDETPLIQVENIHPDVFQHLLNYMYSGECELTSPGPCSLIIADADADNNKKNNTFSDETPDTDMAIGGHNVSAYEMHQKQQEGGKRKSRGNKKEREKEEFDDQSNPLSLARDAARQLGLTKLVRQFDAVRYEDGNILWSESSKRKGGSLPSLRFDRKRHPELYDVCLCSTDSKKFSAHKCILAARSEYFHHMLAGGWIETRSSRELSLPLHSSVLELLLDYLYKDTTPVLDGANSDDMELAWKALIAADQLLITPFRARCEVALASMLTLRNVATMLEMACTYNADQLRNCCYQYICFNLPAILEARSLECVTPQILDGLRDYCHNLYPCMSRRIITPFSDAPTSDEIQAIAAAHPVSWNPEEDMDFDNVEDLNSQSKLKMGVKKKSRLRRTSDSRRNRNESISSTNSDDMETAIDAEPMDWSEIVEKTESNITLSLSQMAVCEKENKNANGAEPWVKIVSSSKLQRAVQGRLRAAAIAREENLDTSFTILTPQKESNETVSQVLLSPPYTPVGVEAPPSVQTPFQPIQSPTKPVAPEVLQKHFPQLGQNDSARTPPKPSTTSSSTSCNLNGDKRPVKLSQKQRKKLAAEEFGTLSPLSPSTSKGWGSAVETRESFSDIMQQEKKVKQPWSASSVSVPVSASSASIPISSSPWNKMASAPSPATPPATPPSSAVPNLSSTNNQLTDIIANELKLKENWSRMRAKPLSLTQIEDKAIDDLMIFYNAHNSSEERITVQRVVNTQVAKPLWVTSRH